LYFPSQASNTQTPEKGIGLVEKLKEREREREGARDWEGLCEGEVHLDPNLPKTSRTESSAAATL